MALKPPPGLIQKQESLFRRLGLNAVYFLSSVNHPNLIQLFLCALIVAVQILIVPLPVFERLENIVFDSFFRKRPPLERNSDIVIIEIAEDSIQALGRWPWPRHYHAGITHILNAWGAKAIVFDILFSEPSTAFDDEALVQAIQEKNNVYLPVILEPQKKEMVWIHSLAPMEASAKGLGHINITPDGDGTLRRIQPFLNTRGEWYPHLAIRVAFDQMKAPWDKDLFPLDRKGNLIVNWAGKWENTFEHYSYKDLIKSFQMQQSGETPKISPDKIRGKICLIGLTATGHADIKASPLESVYPAMGIHANLINSVLHQNFIVPPTRHLNTMILILLGFLIMPFLIPFKNVASPVASVMTGFLWILISFYFFSRKGMGIYVVSPLFLILSLFVFSALYAQILGKKERLRLFNLATRDGLTGLYVIRHFKLLLNQAVFEAKRKKEPLSLILIDIDNFKKINDVYGHQAGDMVLKVAAQQILTCVRYKRPDKEADIVARYGGEEIIILVRNTNLTETAFNIAERIRKTVAEANFIWEQTKLVVTISLGVSTSREGDLPEALIRRADEALYRAKHEGKNKVCIESNEITLKG